MIEMQTARAADGTGTARADEAADAALLAALPSQSRWREVWVGLFVIFGAIATLIALFTLTDAATFRGRYIITTVVEDAGGIRRGDPVVMRGVNIGRVQKFEMVPEGVAIRLELEGEYRVPTDSHIVLRSSGVLGGMTAEVVPGTAGEVLDGGDVIRGANADGVFDVASQIGDRADAVLGRVQQILSDQTISAVGESATELEALLGELSALAVEQRRELGTLTGSLQRAISGVERATDGPELERAVQQLDAVMAQMAETSTTLASASASLETILGRMERGEGTLGRLSVDESLYVNLDEAVRELTTLLADFREDPSRYIDLKVF